MRFAGYVRVLLFRYATVICVNLFLGPDLIVRTTGDMFICSHRPMVASVHSLAIRYFSIRTNDYSVGLSPKGFFGLMGRSLHLMIRRMGSREASMAESSYASDNGFFCGSIYIEQ